jgi:hypothetical protein
MDGKQTKAFALVSVICVLSLHIVISNHPSLLKQPQVFDHLT